MILQRAEELKRVPYLRDAQLLPSEEDCAIACQHHWVYRRYIEARRAWEPRRWEFYDQCLADATRLGEIWDTVASARRAEYYVVCRRRHLAKLKDLLGEDAYHAGRLPPATPIWRYEER